MTILSCDCLNITEEEEKPKPGKGRPRAQRLRGAGAEGNLLPAFRTGFFCHSRGSLRFDLSVWTLENVPRVPLGKENSYGEPGRGQT